jgi:hypothetical protein
MVDIVPMGIVGLVGLRLGGTKKLGSLKLNVIKLLKLFYII